MIKTTFKTLGYTALGAITVLIVFYVGLNLFGSWHDEWSGYNASTMISDGVCNVAVVPIIGTILPYAGADEDGSGNVPPPSTNMSDTLSLIGSIEADPNIQGILVRVDSTGGSPVASEMIAKELKNSSMPVGAMITESGASGGYLIATGADTIFASSFSDVGSIGVTMSYVDNTKQNADTGLQFISLSSGKYKDAGSPDKPLTTEERALFERDLKIYHDTFVKEVAENRNLPVEDVAKLADGWSMPASLALENKLIDAIGDKEDVRAWFAEKLNLPTEEVVFCQ